MAASGDGVARQAELRWIEGNVCFKKVPLSMQEPPSHPKPPPRALMRAPPSTPPYMVKVPRSGVDKGHKASGDSLRVREPDIAQASWASASVVDGKLFSN